MNATRLALVAVAAWLALQIVAKRRRSRLWASARSPSGTATAPEALNAGNGAPGTGIDSPNEAERLQARGVASPGAESGQPDNLFRSTSQESAEAQAPGLPDFARGA
jgi:hypothetical protein